MNSNKVILPQPVHKYEVYKEETNTKNVKTTTVVIPPYLKRDHFIPRRIEDFGDGGAFPEIHIAQYPLNMGKADESTEGNVLSVGVDVNGSANLAKGILTQGRAKNQIVYSKLTDMIESDANKESLSLSKPSQEEIEANRNKTREALQKLLNKKIGFKSPTQIIPNEAPKSDFIKYTPVDGLTGQKKTQRIIRIVEEQQDPLDPNMYKLHKLPPGQGSPPVPVMHSPPKKLTLEDQEAWKIPPCISNWKNTGGKMVPLDKRLAADGKDLKHTEINEKFAVFSGVLQENQRQRREENAELVRLVRAQKEQENARNREKLAKMAIEQLNNKQKQVDKQREEDQQSSSYQEKQDRDRIRNEQREERKREYNLKHAGRQTKAQRDQDRDVSERIALGETSLVASQGVQYDSRLFNQTSGLTSNFGNDDEYNVYDTPLFSEKNASIYNIKFNKSAVEAESTFAQLNDLGPKIGDEGKSKTYKRTGPLEFEEGISQSTYKQDSSKKQKLSNSE